MFSSLKVKLAFSHLGIIFCTASILAFITYWTGVQIHKSDTYNNLRRNSIISSIVINNFLTNKHNFLHRISDSKEIELYEDSFQEVYLHGYFANFIDEFSSLSYISQTGREKFRLDNGKVNYSLRDLSNSEQFRQALETPNEVFLSVAYPGQNYSSLSLVFTTAKERSIGDHQAHIIQAAIDLKELEKHLLEFSPWARDSLIVADSKNTILIHPQRNQLLNKIQLLDKKHGTGNVEQLGFKGLYNLLEMESPEWNIINVLPFDIYLAAPIKYAKIVFAVFCCILLLGLLVVNFIARKINAPIIDLTKAVKSISSGQKIELLQPYNIEELDNLVEAFNTVSFELTETSISKNYLNSIVNSLKECLIVTSLDGTIESANKMTFDLVGYTEEQLIGQSIKKIFSDKFNLDTYIAGGKSHDEIETSFKTSEQEEIPIIFSQSFLKSDDGENLGIVCLALDIRKRKKIEEDKEKLKVQLQKAQRLETVGTLASGIAHDFNNILTIIIGYSQILNFTIEDEDGKKSLEQILAASNRAKDLVQQLLEFSRQKSHTKIEISLVPIIKEIVKMLKSSIPASIDISLQVDQNCSSIIADPTQIQQIIMNFCSNAVHAIGDYGTLTIKLDDEQVTEKNISEYQGVAQGKYVKLMVCDTGHGIKESDIDRIFDPFFSTKDVSEGTGLGLAVVHGMIQSLDGHIFVESKEDVGTTFTVLLPALIKNRDGEANFHPALTPSLLQGKGEHILFVDDEKALSILGKRNLESLGYKVTSVTKPEEALELFRKEPDKFDLLITDFSMPKLQGDKLIHEIKQIKKDLPVILCTGYHAKLVKKGKIIEAYRSLEKPYTNQQLANEVKEALGENIR